MILLLDTSVLIDVLRDRKDRRYLLAALTEEGHQFATSTVNIGEVYAGLRDGERSEADPLLSSLLRLPVTYEIGRRAGEQKRFYAARGLTFGLIDMIVAATALEHSITLLTDNVKDFLNPNLILYPLP